MRGSKGGRTGGQVCGGTEGRDDGDEGASAGGLVHGSACIGSPLPGASADRDRLDEWRSAMLRPRPGRSQALSRARAALPRAHNARVRAAVRGETSTVCPGAADAGQGTCPTGPTQGLCPPSQSSQPAAPSSLRSPRWSCWQSASFQPRRRSPPLARRARESVHIGPTPTRRTTCEQPRRTAGREAPQGACEEDDEEEEACGQEARGEEAGRQEGDSIRRHKQQRIGPDSHCIGSEWRCALDDRPSVHLSQH
jgi:hypothetical protein